MSRPDEHRPSDAPRPDGREADGLDTHAVGADLLAHLRGELEPESARALDERLAASPELRALREQLADDLAALAPAARDAHTAPPPRAPLERLLTEIEDEAGERRAAHALRTSPLPVEFGETIVAHALGQLTGTAALEADRALAASPTAAAEAALVGRLVTATRRAYALQPAAASREAVVGAFRRGRVAQATAGLRDVPAPETRPPAGGRMLRMLLPALIAAAAVVLLSLVPIGGSASHVVVGEVMHWPDLDRPGRLVEATDGGFEFEAGNVIATVDERVTVHVACRKGVDAAVSGAPVAGSAALTLLPGARLRRDATSEFTLLAGRIEVWAAALDDRLTIRSGDLYAAVRGTRFELGLDDGRLVAIVSEGRVELGRGGPKPASLVLGAGEHGLVDATRLLPEAEASLAPRASLRLVGGSVPRGRPVPLIAELLAGAGGGIQIAAFEPSQPFFLVRLTAPDGRVHEMKLQESMLTDRAPTPAADGSWSLADTNPYRLEVALPTYGLEPGMWEASLRYMSYRANASGREWLGVVQSPPVKFEVTAE